MGFPLTRLVAPGLHALEAGLRSRSRSRSWSQSVSVVLLGVGVGVGVDKIYRLRPTPGKLLFPIQRNRHVDYLTLLVAGGVVFIHPSGFS